MQDMDTRLNRLERSVVVQRRVIGGLLLLVLGTLLVGAQSNPSGSEPGTIRAHRIEILDDSGQVALSLDRITGISLFGVRSEDRAPGMSPTAKLLPWGLFFFGPPSDNEKDRWREPIVKITGAMDKPLPGEIVLRSGTGTKIAHLGGENPEPEWIRAAGVEIVNDSGRVMARLGPDLDEAALHFYGPNSEATPEAELNRSGLTLWAPMTPDEENKRKQVADHPSATEPLRPELVTITVTKPREGRMAAGWIELSGSSGKGRVDVMAGTGGGSISLDNDQGEHCSMLGCTGAQIIPTKRR